MRPTNQFSRTRIPAFIVSLLMVGLFFLTATCTPGAQVAVNLHSFTGPDGSHPRATLALGNDGFIYGTTVQGGASNNGSIFRISTDGAFTSLHSFTGPDGAGAYGLTLGKDGNFYGATVGGGTHTNGTIFRISPAGDFASLYSFDGTNHPGPFAPLVQGTDGNFYGVTFQGGLSNKGSVFKISPGGSFTSLHSFNSTDGFNPYGPLVEGPDGNFYGTTHGGGTNVLGVGTAFRITPDGALTTLHFFHTSDGAGPFGGLTLGTDGNFYGTTFSGGANNVTVVAFGTVFRMAPDGTVTVLHTFVTGDPNNPEAGLLLASDRYFYGTTTSGGLANIGGIFRISPDGNYAMLHSFIPSEGGMPIGGLIQASDGSFYCTTYTNAAAGLGSVFKLTTPLVCSATETTNGCACPVLKTLHSFSRNDGATIGAELTATPDGNFVGMTLQGGNSDLGTIFSVSPSGAFSTLHKFAGVPTDGQNPSGGLVLGPDNALYGTATSGGTTLAGSFFRITTNGDLVNLHSFVANIDGHSPESTPILGKDGSFYGTCTGGGSGKRGTVFRITGAGDLTVLHSFSGPDGDLPFAGLVEGTNGDFYGTSYGGASSTGNVFRVTSTGAFASLHDFTGPDGSYPQGELVFGNDGKLYGTTVTGGTGTVCPKGCGTIFRINTDGSSFESLYSFHGDDGASPFSALLLGKDGHFYGTADSGGDYGLGGTVFQFTPPNALNTLYSFTGSGDGRGPTARLVQGADGALYGTTQVGGLSANCTFGCGTVFRLCIPLSGTSSSNTTASALLVGNALTVQIASTVGKTFQLQVRDSLGVGDWSDLGNSVPGTGSPVAVTVPFDAQARRHFYRFKIL
jgi:uncharacterized repeat protein (TIGR03803 family)